MASLRDLGLSEYEARAYRSLLETGPTTAKELSEESDVPMGRVYDVLNSLERYDLVRAQATGRPKKYAPVEPDTGLDRLLDRKRREARREVRQYEEAVEELAGELDAPADAGGEEFWTAALGTENAVELLVERVAAADDRVVMVADEQPAVDLDDVGERVTEALAAAADRGVEVELLMHPDLYEAIPAPPEGGPRGRLVDADRFEARLSPSVSGTFNLIDESETCIRVPDPLAGGGVFAMIDVKDPAFAGRLREQYRPRWREADPVGE